MRLTRIFLITAIMGFIATSHAAGITRERVQERGQLRCGVSTGIPGFSNVDGKGSWSGLDVDICRAVAAAVLEDGDKVEFVPLLPKERSTALLAGDVDILSRNYAWNLTRDAALNMNFAAVTFYDLQGFLVGKSSKVESILDYGEFSVCLQSGTTYEQSLDEYLHQSGLRYKTVFSDTPDQLIKDFEDGRCQVITGGRAQLQGIRSKMAEPGQTVFLPEIIANIPLGPAVRHGDDNWFDIVKWTVFAMINAEELQVSSANVDEMVSSPLQAVQLFLGRHGESHKGLGLDSGWTMRVIREVGNYGECYSRNLGDNSPLKLKRGLNNLWNQGGILSAPPLR